MERTRLFIILASFVVVGSVDIFHDLVRNDTEALEAHPFRASKWPVFKNKAALTASPKWKQYFHNVYGQVPSKGYPINIAHFWILWDEEYAGNLPSLVGKCPSKNAANGQHYRQNNMYIPPGTSWIWHKYPYHAVAGDAWVEVQHMKDPFGDEHIGAWFMYAPGSGVYFYTGRTIDFAEHSDAYNHFSASGNEDMCRKAVKAGYASVQFTAHVDSTNYPCAAAAGLAYMNLEIVGVDMSGTFSCTNPAGITNQIRGGWMASKTCFCDEKLSYLNCRGSAPPAPPPPPVHPIWRCRNGDHIFTSQETDCEGAEKKGLLGHLGSVKGPGMHVLNRCRHPTGYQFDSQEADCEGAGTLTGPLGYAWNRGTSFADTPIYRCLISKSKGGQVRQMTSISPTCEGLGTMEGPLGFIAPVSAGANDLENVIPNSSVMQV